MSGWPIGARRASYRAQGRPDFHKPAGASSLIGRLTGRDPIFWWTSLLLGATLLLGGSSREHAIQLMLLELISLPLIPVAAWRLHKQTRLTGLKTPLALLAAILALPLMQLIPIPFPLWESLPGRGDAAQAMRLAGVLPAFLPFSVTPQATWSGFLALLIPSAIFLGAAACTPDQRRWLGGLVVLAAGLSILLGLAQVVGGPQSFLRFYPTTNPDSAVGLFANRNHQAIFLLIALPLLTPWIGLMARGGKDRLVLLAVLCLGLLGTALVSVAITRSRAGLVLTAPALIGTIAILWRQRGRQGLSAPVGGSLLAAGAALIGVGFFAIDAVLRRFSPTFSEDYRIEVWPYVAKAAVAFSPAGSGMGSFEAVYRAFEPPELMGPSFVNHAHNEYLQFWLEGGWPGLALLAWAGLWALRSSILAWPSVGPRFQQGQIASVVIGLLALHAIVDYPTRTPAIMGLLALMAACLSAVGSPRHERRSS